MFIFLALVHPHSTRSPFLSLAPPFHPCHHLSLSPPHHHHPLTMDRLWATSLMRIQVSILATGRSSFRRCNGRLQRRMVRLPHCRQSLHQQGCFGQMPTQVRWIKDQVNRFITRVGVSEVRAMDPTRAATKGEAPTTTKLSCDWGMMDHLGDLRMGVHGLRLSCHGGTGAPPRMAHVDIPFNTTWTPRSPSTSWHPRVVGGELWRMLHVMTFCHSYGGGCEHIRDDERDKEIRREGDSYHIH